MTTTTKNNNLIFKIDEKMARNNNLSLTDIAVMANISKYRNNNVTEFRYGKNIADTLGISLRTIERSVASLKDNFVFDKVEKVNMDGKKEWRNKYFFTPLETGFILVADEIFELGLTADEIGFLIRAKANAFNNGMTLKGNKEKLAAFIGVSVSKFNKLFNSLLSKGFISYETSLMTLTCDLFSDTSKKTVKPTAKTLEIINMHKDILKSHIEAYNRKGNKITKLTNEAIEKLKMDGLSAATCKVATYFVNGFSNVKDINKLINSIQFPKVKKEEVKEEWATFTI